jgi:hypothetical protein
LNPIKVIRVLGVGLKRGPKALIKAPVAVGRAVVGGIKRSPKALLKAPGVSGRAVGAGLKRGPKIVLKAPIVSGRIVMAGVKRGPKAGLKGATRAARLVGTGIKRFLQAIIFTPVWVVGTIWRAVKASPRATLSAPVRAYRRLTVGRDWVLAKIEYLQAESARWKTAFNIVKSPYSLLRACGLSPQICVGLLFAGSTVGTGVIVNETLLSERSFSNGDPGIYLAPDDIPVSYITDPAEDGYNTLRVDLGSVSVRSIVLEHISVGSVFTGSALPSGEQNVVDIGGNVISGGTNTRLDIGHLIFEQSRCKKLTLSDIQAHTLIVRGNASDGQSLAPSAGTGRMLAIGGGHQQAAEMIHSGGTFDRILIQAPTSGVNGKIGTLRLTNLYTKGGECVLSRITAGTVEILLNEVGMGDGFSTKEFVISTNVTAANITVEDNVEVTIAEPATN